MKIKKITKKIQFYLHPKLILIYQFGKVGSTSINNSLANSVHVHDLYGNVLCPPGFNIRHSYLYRKCVFPLYRILTRLLIKTRKSTRIIVPIRDPSERNLSLFFQDLPFWYVEYFSKNKGYAKTEGLDFIKEIFLKSFDHESPDRWFNQEFCRFTGISFDDIVFNKEKGWVILERGKFECLIIVSSLLRTDLGRKIVEDFSGETIIWEIHNRGNHKWYGDVYEKMKSDKEFISNYKSKLSDSIVMNKFF